MNNNQNTEFEKIIKEKAKNNLLWFTVDEISSLFDVSIKSVKYHIAKILSDNELDNSSYHIFKDNKIIYNLDMVITISYHIKSQKSISFRKFISSSLNKLLTNDCSLSSKEISFSKAIDLNQNNDETLELNKVIEIFTLGLDLLDDYDHHKIDKPLGNKTVCKLEYNEARNIINSMKFNLNSSLFGVEKEEGKLNGILMAIYQNIFDEDVYKTIEEKAAHLLYFIVKDHPFFDGCKRIAATLFLEFLNKNNRLFKDGNLVISNNSLVALTLLTAVSIPEEKDTIINIIMHLLLNNGD